MSENTKTEAKSEDERLAERAWENRRVAEFDKTSLSNWVPWCELGDRKAGVVSLVQHVRELLAVEQVPLLTASELAEVVETWESRHRGEMDRDPKWAKMNLACDVAEAQRRKLRPAPKAEAPKLPSVEEFARELELALQPAVELVPDDYLKVAQYLLDFLAAPPAQPEAPTPEPTYPCHECGKPRTAAEGGKIFSVCDACWDKKYPKQPPAPTPETATPAIVDVAQALTDYAMCSSGPTGPTAQARRMVEVAIDQYVSRATAAKDRECEALKQRVAEFEEAAGEAQGIDEENHHLRLRVKDLEAQVVALKNDAERPTFVEVDREGVRQSGRVGGAWVAAQVIRPVCSGLLVLMDGQQFFANKDQWRWPKGADLARLKSQHSQAPGGTGLPGVSPEVPTVGTSIEVWMDRDRWVRDVVCNPEDSVGVLKWDALEGHDFGGRVHGRFTMKNEGHTWRRVPREG